MKLALAQPLIPLSEKRQDMVEAFVEDHNTRRSLQVYLGQLGTQRSFC